MEGSLAEVTIDPPYGDRSDGISTENGQFLIETDLHRVDFEDFRRFLDGFRTFDLFLNSNLDDISFKHTASTRRSHPRHPEAPNSISDFSFFGGRTNMLSWAITSI